MRRWLAPLQTGGTVIGVLLNVGGAYSQTVEAAGWQPWVLVVAGTALIVISLGSVILVQAKRVDELTNRPRIASDLLDFQKRGDALKTRLLVQDRGDESSIALWEHDYHVWLTALCDYARDKVSPVAANDLEKTPSYIANNSDYEGTKLSLYNEILASSHQRDLFYNLHFRLKELEEIIGKYR